MSTENKSCDAPLHRSICAVEAILADIRETYEHIGGGGIGEVRQVATDRYAVTMLHEEGRRVTRTYTATVTDGEVTVTLESEDTETRGQ